MRRLLNSMVVQFFIGWVGMKIKIFLALLFLSSSALAQQDLLQPRTQEELDYVRVQRERTRALLDSDQELVNLLKSRAQELVPQNAPLKINYFNHEYQLLKGSLVQLGSSGSEDKLIVDVKSLPQGAVVVDFRVSPDESKILYGYAINGTDWQTWYVLDLNTLKKCDGPFQFKNTGNAEMSWAIDSKGVFYPSSAGIIADLKALRSPGVKYHELGAPLENDHVIFSGINEESSSSRWNAKAYDNEYAIVYRDQGIAEIPLAAFLVKIKPQGLVEAPQALVATNKYFGKFIGVHGSEIFLRTSEWGSNYSLVAINPISNKLRVVIPEMKEETLYQVSLLKSGLITFSLGRDLTVRLRTWDFSGKMLKLYMPDDFGIPHFAQPSLPLMNGDHSSEFGHMILNSVEAPSVTLRYDSAAGTITKLESKSIPFDGSRIQRKLVFYKSYDERIIPMFVFSRTDLKGPASYAYLYSYGFIGIPNLSQFNRKFQLALDLGAIVALPLLRGGGEFGLDWQLEGTKNRWKTLLDNVYAARWLKKNMSIHNQRVVVSGRSFGGMTTLAHYSNFQEEFDLYSAVVPVSDLSAFIRDGSGWWAGDDFGIRRNNLGQATPLAYAKLYTQIDQWNPYFNLYKIKNTKPLIVFSGDNDTRVDPEQASKYVRALQQKWGVDAPIYLHEQIGGGHNARAEIVDEQLFIIKMFSINPPFKFLK